MEKSKLKLFSIMLAAMLFMLNFTFLGVNAVSDTNTYEIPELAMTMDIPTKIKVITKGIKQSDPIFSTETFDYIQTMSKFREYDDYFYGKDLKESFEFEVILTEDANGIVNFMKISEKKKNSVLESVSQQSDVMESSIYKTDTATYIEISRSINKENSRLFTKEYYTIYDSYDLTVKLTSNNDNLTIQELELLKSIVDSIQFPKGKNIKLSEVISISEIFSFCLITMSFVILVINKIQNIKREEYRMKRQQNRMKERMEREAKEKEEIEQQITTIKSNEIEQSVGISNNKPTDEAERNDLSKTFFNEDTKNTEDLIEKNKPQNISTPKIENTINNEIDNESDSIINQYHEIDLDMAIANFGNSSEKPKERHNNNNKNRKKFKLPFGK